MIGSSFGVFEYGLLSLSCSLSFTCRGRKGWKSEESERQRRRRRPAYHPRRKKNHRGALGTVQAVGWLFSLRSNEENSGFCPFQGIWNFRRAAGFPDDAIHHQVAPQAVRAQVGARIGKGRIALQGLPCRAEEVPFLGCEVQEGRGRSLARFHQ